MSTATRRPVSVEELQRAFQAVKAGTFRRDTSSHSLVGARRDSASTWESDQPVVPVISCSGGAGATTTALAIATAAETSRVTECCSVTSSGLSAAPTAELGQTPDGWSRGTRGSVLVERASEVFTSPDEVTLPAEPPAGCELTVLDVAWDLSVVLSSPSWLSDQILSAPAVVVVSRATVPAMRRLEGATTLLEDGPTVIAAVIGPRRKKWPRVLQASMGAFTRRLDADGLLVDLPHDADLALNGLTGRAIPTPLISAASHLLRLTGAGNTTTKG